MVEGYGLGPFPRSEATMHDDVRDLVLLIDDDFSVRKVHAKVLSRAGFSIESVAGGAEALALWRRGCESRHRHRLAHAWHRWAGLHARRAQARSDVRVIIVTGYPSLDSAVRVIEYGGFATSRSRRLPPSSSPRYAARSRCIASRC